LERPDEGFGWGGHRRAHGGRERIIPPSL
jgi:hypothetical protein